MPRPEPATAHGRDLETPAVARPVAGGPKTAVGTVPLAATLAEAVG